MIPPLEPTADCPRELGECVRSALDRELLRKPLTEQMAPQPGVLEAPKTEREFAKAAHPKRAITGAKYFTSSAALDEQEESDPWTAEDPWSRAESLTGSCASFSPLSAEFAKQNAELEAARIDIVSLFTTHQVSGGLPAPTDEPGKGETPQRSVKRLQFSITTPESGSDGRTRRFDGWNRRKADASTSPTPPMGDGSSLHTSSPGSVLSAPTGSTAAGSNVSSDFTFIPHVDILHNSSSGSSCVL